MSTELVKELLAAPHAQPNTKCDPKIWKHGVQVFRFAGPRSWMIECWVKAVRKVSGRPVDWHFAAGRAIILCLQKDIEAVETTCKELLPHLEEAAMQAAEPDSLSKKYPQEYPAVQILGWSDQPRPPKPEDWPEGAIAWAPDTGFMMEDKG